MCERSFTSGKLSWKGRTRRGKFAAEPLLLRPTRETMHVMRAERIWFCGLMLGLLGCAVQGEDFSTTNRHKLARFWQLMESRSRPVTVLSFGDSMADSYKSITYYLIRRLEERFGAAGYSLNSYRNTLG